MKNYSGSLAVPVAIIVAFSFAVVTIIVWLVFATAARAGESCLTKAEARAKYPKQTIYWHTINHCWDNVGVRARKADASGVQTPRPRYSVNRNPLLLGKPPLDSNGNIVRHSSRPVLTPSGPVIFYPSLIAGGGTSDDMLTPHTMSSWSSVADFDADPPPFLPWQRVSGLFQQAGERLPQ